MNNKGIKRIGMYVVLGIIVIAALIIVFYLVEQAKEYGSAKPLSTTTTQVIEEPNSKNNNEKETMVATPFKTALSNVIHGRVFAGNYKESFTYNNTIFDINCNNYDDTNKVCLEGSALMRYNDIAIPLYSFSNPSDNYLDYANDFYIDINSDYIFITMNQVGVRSGKTLVLKSDGTLIGEINNVLTGYKFHGNLVRELYPNYTDGKFNFYYEDRGLIKIGYVDILDLNKKVQLEIVKGAILN